MARLARRTKTLIAALGAAALLLSPLAQAPAQAEVVTTGAVYTLADGPICGGIVQMMGTTATDKPGTLDLQAVGTFIGISGTDRPCTLGVSMVWRNLTEGTGGAVHGQVAGLWPGAPTKSAWGTAKTGAGLVEFWLVPHRPYLATPHLRIRVT